MTKSGMKIWRVKWMVPNLWGSECAEWDWVEEHYQTEAGAKKRHGEVAQALAEVGVLDCDELVIVEAKDVYEGE